MEGTIGEIRLFGGNFAPRGWAYCDGSLISIAEYTALYSLVGTTYGGDGQATFGVPDFRGRAAVGTGTGPGLPTYDLGELAGTEAVTMLTSQMPMHTHVSTASVTIPSYNGTVTSGTPSGAVLAALDGAYSTDTSDTNLATQTLQTTMGVSGGSQPFSIMQPIGVANYIICVEGIYPSRN